MMPPYDPEQDPTQQAPPDPGAPPSAPGLSLAKMWVLSKMKAKADLDAAQAQAADLRQQAEGRSSMRNAQDLFTHRAPTGDAYRAQLMQDSQQPVRDVAQQTAAREQALRETLQQGGLQVADYQSKLLQQKNDPTSDISAAARAMAATAAPGLMAKLGPLAGRLSAAQIEAQIPGMKTLSEARASSGAGAASEATAGKTSEEAKQVPLAGKAARAVQAAEVPLKEAETEKAAAEAAKIRSLTGSEVVPGYSRGSIPIDEAEATKINDEYKGNLKAKNSIDEILKITGDQDWIVDPKRRAQLQPRLAALIGDLRGSVGIQRLAGPEMAFAQKIINNPTEFSASNILGLAHNRTRFQAVKAGIDNAWNATVQAKDLRSSRNSGPVKTITKGGKTYNKLADGSWVEG